MSLLIPTQLLFLDTEFTSLGEPWPVQMISAALCDSEGNPLFYAEADEFDPELVHDFTRSRVIPLLERGDKAIPFPLLCERFFEAIANVGAPVALAADSDWDWLWVQMMAQRRQMAEAKFLLDDPSILPLWPANLSPAMAKINFHALGSIDKKASWKASAEHFRDKYPHHALADAVGNAKSCKAAIESTPGLKSSDVAAFFSVFKGNLQALSWTPKARLAPSEGDLP